MKIFRSGRDDVAETVKIGDKLVMVIEIDQQDMYGMRISNCVVRDGLNLAEQLLINDQGCPLDETIMPKFDYTNNFTRAAVSFPAHKFPHTSSVYYQCNVRLCINNGNCDQANCQPAGAIAEAATTTNNLAAGAASSPVGSQVAPSQAGGPRRKRFATGHGQLASAVLARRMSSTVAATQGDPLQMARSEPVAAMLPAPSGLSSDDTPGGRTRRSEKRIGRDEEKADEEASENGELSFDVYSGLYVSDADVGQQQSDTEHDLSPAPSGSSRASADADAPKSRLPACLGWPRASLLVGLASCLSVGLLILLACQVGFLGPSESDLSFSSSCPVVAGQTGPFAPNYQVAPRPCLVSGGGFARLNQPILRGHPKFCPTDRSDGSL